MKELVPRSAVVYTPSELARAMVASIGDHADARWLDPCVGDGAFIEEIAALSVPKERIIAFDINPKPSKKEELAQTHWEKDFLEWVLTEGSQQSIAPFDRIILNPPYVALSRIPKSLSKLAVSLDFPGGSKLSLKANYWCAFLIASWKVLAPGGSLCAVLPAAWDYAYYAKDVRTYLREAFAEFAELRSERPLFGNVQEGSVVIVGRGYVGSDRSNGGLCRNDRFEVRDSAEIQAKLYNLAEGLGTHAGRILRPRSASRTEMRLRKLREVVDIRIGAVTGDSRYFVLSEPRRRELGLPLRAVLPVLSRANQLSAAVAGKKLWERLRDQGRRIWLFRPPRRTRTNPAVRRYLRRAEAEGGCRRKRYKINTRRPWSITPLPGRIDGFLSGMSKCLPFLVLKDMPQLTATNTLYIVRFKDPLLKSRKARARKAAWGVALLSSGVRRQMEKLARVYADGLLKLEPSELGSVDVPEPPRKSGAMQVLLRATSLLLAGRHAEAESLADGWLGIRKEVEHLGPLTMPVTSLSAAIDR